MKNLTIAKKLAAITGVALILLVVVTMTGLSSASAVGEDAARLSRMPGAIRGATTADMHHDAVLAVVTLALSSPDPEALKTAKVDLAAKGQAFKDELGRAKAANASPEAGAIVDSLGGDVDAYIVKAQAVLDGLTADQPTDALYSDFYAQFKKLEANLPPLAEAIQSATKQADAAASDSIASGRTLALLLCLAAVIGLSVVSWVISRSIVRPIKHAAHVLQLVAMGDLSQRVEVSGGDEVADMGTALNEALENLSGTISEIGRHSSSLAAASEELNAVSSQLASAAQETSTQAGVVSSSAGQVSQNVAVVASGTGEMSASILEISHGAQDAVAVAKEATRVAHATNVTVSKLGASSAEIGDVIKVITSIAEQTNLLALNATIEAARAGEAGKGFAVVAHEVKELASATAAATADISDRIGAIQGDAEESVRAINEITEIISRVSETQTTIASAVEEQTATTNEIGRNVAEAADNSNEIARNISGVAQAAEEASHGASNTLDTAGELSRMAGELHVLVSGFTC
jgi:methyl-accepting chemotaxis protein